MSLHIGNIVAEGELTLEATRKDFFLVQTEGKSRVTTRAVDHYNLDMILSIGYRVKSKAAASFRRWANSVLKEYLLRGYAIDERRALVTPENYLGLVHRVDSLDERVSKLEKDENYYFRDRVIYEGHVFEALTLIDSLVRKAVSSIVLIDPYCDIRALDCLKGKDKSVGLRIITSTKTTLSPKEVNAFNREYGNLKLAYDDRCHDRYLVVDDAYFYHLGASLNGLGKKLSQITRVEDEDVKNVLRERIH